MWLLLLSLSTRIPLGCRVYAFGLVPPNPSPGYSGCLCLTSWPRDSADPAPRALGAPAMWKREVRAQETPAVGWQAGCSCLLMSVPKVTLSVVSGRAIDFTVNY